MLIFWQLLGYNKEFEKNCYHFPGRRHSFFPYDCHFEVIEKNKIEKIEKLDESDKSKFQGCTTEITNGPKF